MKEVGMFTRLLTAIGTAWQCKWCFLMGHAPIVQDKEEENKSVLECERCGRFLKDFVLNLHRNQG